MINPEMVEEFLNRKLRMSSKAKLFNEEAIDQKLAALDPPPIFDSTQPRLHQKVGFLLAITYGCYGIFFKMGLGKTFLTLMIFRYLRQSCRVRRGLVLVRSVDHVREWTKMARKHMPSLRIEGALGEREQREAVLLGDAELMIITYAGWASFICGREVIDDADPKSKKKMVIVDKLAKPYESRFDFVAWDEIPFVYNHTSLYHKACWRLAKVIEYRFGLTGTPFSKNPEKLWGIFRLIDRGETLGTTLGMFRSAFMREVEDWFAGTVYKFDPTKEAKLHEVIQHRSIYYATEECIGLPEIVPIVKEISLTKEIWAYYERLVEDMKEADGNFTLVKNVYTRMRSLPSGWLSYLDPEGRKKAIIFGENPKLDRLVEVLRDIGEEQAVVFNIYKRSGVLIEERLKVEKIKHVRLYSKTKNRATVVDKFVDDPKCRVMVSSEAGGMGNNWQNARYVIFFESPTDPAMRAQMIARCHRDGQDKTVYVIDLTVVGSIEPKILKSIEKGEDLFQTIMAGKDLDKLYG